MLFVVDNDTNEYSVDNEVPDNLKSFVAQKESCGISKEGWLWMGGIQGDSDDPGGALEEAISKLKCRYALKYSHFSLTIFLLTRIFFKRTYYLIFQLC